MGLQFDMAEVTRKFNLCNADYIALGTFSTYEIYNQRKDSDLNMVEFENYLLLQNELKAFVLFTSTGFNLYICCMFLQLLRILCQEIKCTNCVFVYLEYSYSAKLQSLQ